MKTMKNLTSGKTLVTPSTMKEDIKKDFINIFRSRPGKREWKLGQRLSFKGQEYDSERESTIIPATPGGKILYYARG